MSHSNAAASSTGPEFEVLGQVLVVEDNVVNQKVSKAMLQRLGFAVDIANNGQEGVDKWEHGHYDAIIMDCQMPVLDGYSATAIIRQREQLSTDPAKRRMPIIALTAHGFQEERRRCLESGMDDFLTKPVSIGELGATLHQWIFAARMA